MDKHTPINRSVAEIIHLLYDLTVLKQYKFNDFLEHFIKVILKIIPADSCLIYFYDLDSKNYILIGSKKPHPREIGNIIMREGEGITGWVAKNKKSLALSEKAYKDPRFKSFKELPEDLYESFLSVPIVDDTGTVGVINLQNRLPYQFSEQQIDTVECLVKIIASAFAKLTLEQKVNQLENKLEERKAIERAKGLLMKVRQMSEDQAFSFIRKEAMNKRKSLKEIADAILLVLS